MIQEEWEENKKKIVNLVNDELYVPMKAKEIAMLIGITKKKRAALYRMLDELVEEGKIIRTESERYMKTDSSKIFEGVFSASKSGSGFVSVPGVEEDYIIKEKNSLTALNGDKVKILELPPKAGKRKQARIIEIVERGRTSAVGTFFKEGNAAFVTCDDRRFRYDILIKKSGYKGAETGQKVLVDIISYGNYYEYPEGKIVKVIGDKDEPGTDVLSVIIDQNIPYEFSKKALNEAKEKAAEDISAEISKRRDLRDVLTVTIDGEDSKDLDDAISLEKEEDGFCLGVHIADVSHYVKEKSTLDKEALERGTSVYLTDRVIPMLPKALSNGICSLNEGEDRLTLSVIMHLDKKGNVVSHEICESVINSDRRMTYGSVKKILVDKDKEEIKKYKELVPTFKLMERVSKLIRKNREKRGSLDFDFPESKITIDENGKPISVEAYELSVANRIIEDFMLICNETVAKEFYEREIPFVYRTHSKPDPDKIKKLFDFLAKFGYSAKGRPEDIKPKEIQKLTKSIEGKPEEMLLTRLILRAMQQARYTVKNDGHYGLAATDYCHFTSPIRRYPDLQIHRIIKEVINNKYTKKRHEHYESILPLVATMSSRYERRAEECEKEVVKMKKAEYMSERIGEVYDGRISGVTSWGIYVELPNTIEGLVPISNLPEDEYVFDEENYELIGENFNRHYNLGDEVKVVVERADKEERIVDFSLYE